MNSSHLPRIADQLFWDCVKPVSEADWQRYGTDVIERVLEHGDIGDFTEAVRYYGHDKLRQVFAHSRRISERSRAFGRALYGTDFGLGKECIAQFSPEKLWPY